MKILNIMIGLPGCGKSTYCINNLVEGDTYISRDEIRFSLLKPGQTYFSQENNAYNEFIRQIKYAMRAPEYNIYIDATHINSGGRFKLLGRLDLTKDVEICYYFFDTPITECMRRNRTREGLRRVPDSAIRDMDARKQFYITPAEERMYHPVEYHVDMYGELEV